MAARLCRAEREEIRSGIDKGWSIDRIAQFVGRHRETIRRDIAKGGGRHRYRAATAHAAARERAKRPRVRKLASDAELLKRVRKGLKEMSPAPLAHSLRRRGYTISHETIYQECFRKDSLLKDAWSELARARRFQKRRRHHMRGHRNDPNPLGPIVLVTERDAQLPDEPGHWEGDLMAGADSRSAVVVLAERCSRLTIIGALQSQTTKEVVAVVNRLLKPIAPPLRLTLCWDQGRELAHWPKIVEELGIDVFFCHPRSPWEKPLVENTCGLLRRWLKRKTNLYRPQPELDIIAQRLNNTPRRSLQWHTPNERYHQLTATTT